MSTLPLTALIKTLQVDYGLTSPLINTTDEGLSGATHLVATASDKYVVKLYDDNQRANAVASYQRALHDSGSPVPAIIPAKSGELFAVCASEAIVVAQYAEGHPIGWGKEAAKFSDGLTVDIARVLASMHVTTLEAANDVVELDHALSVGQLVREAEGSLATELAKLVRPEYGAIRMAMIHGDLTRENILLDKARSTVQAVIDFGDAHYDYITYDIAMLLTQVYVTKTWGIDFDGIHDFLESYTKYNPLEASELKTILPFMKLRNAGLKHEIETEIAQAGADRESLESIKQSLGTKLTLLETNGRRLEALLTGA